MDVFDGLETSFGTFYPKGFVVAVFGTVQERDAAAKALTDTGFTDVRPIEGSQIVERYQRNLENQNILQKIGAALESDERYASADYVAMAEKGYCFVVVRAADEQEIEEARGIFAPLKALEVKHYGDWVLTDLLGGTT